MGALVGEVYAGLGEVVALGEDLVGGFLVVLVGGFLAGCFGGDGEGVVFGARPRVRFSYVCEVGGYAGRGVA